LGRLLYLVFSFFLLANAAQAEVCALDKLDVRAGPISARFQVEIADTEQLRAIGLMNRPQMGAFAGMLFVYPEPAQVSFWMHNTLIPLDMVFIDETGLVVNVHENAIPLDDTPIYGGSNIRYVLEINGGTLSKLGLGIGAQVRSPLIAADKTLWPCS